MMLSKFKAATVELHFALCGYFFEKKFFEQIALSF